MNDQIDGVSKLEAAKRDMRVLVNLLSLSDSVSDNVELAAFSDNTVVLTRPRQMMLDVIGQ